MKIVVGLAAICAVAALGIWGAWRGAHLNAVIAPLILLAAACLAHGRWILTLSIAVLFVLNLFLARTTLPESHSIPLVFFFWVAAHVFGVTKCALDLWENVMQALDSRQSSKGPLA